jgi:hypothetical protein
MSDSRNRAARVRAVKQEALREYLSNRGKVDYVFDNIEKIERGEGDFQALKAASELRLKLINKYLPDTKHIESELNHTGEVSVRSVRVDGVSSKDA